MIITTSWDDGDILDKRLSELLSRYGIKGTFYITKNYRPDRLTEGDIKDLSNDHEIGAHTLTHPDLSKLSPEEAYSEIIGGKEWLEKVTGKGVEMFCYPSGIFTTESAEQARRAGFIGARTTNRYVHGGVTNPFKMGTTMNVYPLPFRKLDSRHYFWHHLLQPIIQQFSGLRSFEVPFSKMFSWKEAAKSVFDQALKEGCAFHLWGHSWEIEKYGMWEELEEVLRYISNHKECEYLTNSELVQNSQI